MGKDRSLASVDREVPDVIDDLPQPLSSPWRMEAVDPVAELAKFEAAAQLQAKLLPASVKATLPEDWIDQGGKAYLQATGVERLAPMWGLLFGRYTVDKADNEDGSYSFVVRGPVMSRRTGVIYAEVIGGRSSADPFFDEFDDDKPNTWGQMKRSERDAWKRAHRVAPDPLEVRKAAVTNWTTRGASMLMGMRGLTVAYVEGLGIAGIRRVEYGSGGKGGSAAPADLKAKRTALWNDVVKRTGGDLEAARQLLKEVTRYDAYEKKDGTKVRSFDGATVTDNLSERAIDVIHGKLKDHKTFGDKPMREPGEED